jgi:hypothetical protein
MNRSGTVRYWPVAAVLIGASALIGWWVVSSKQEEENRRRLAAERPLQKPVPQSTAQNALPGDESIASEAPKVTLPGPVKVDVPANAPAGVTAFREWARSFFAAPPEKRPAMEERGAELARAHTEVIASLIKSDPQSAIANAVPMVVRQDLPAAIVALLEQRMNVQASFQVFGSVPDPSLPREQQTPAISRRVATEDGREWSAYTYGRRLNLNTRQISSLNGVAVGEDMAVSDSPLRVLEIGERPQSKGRTVETKCPVSGITTPIASTPDKALPPVTPDTPVLETATRIVYVCSGGHITAIEEELAKEEAAAHWASLGVTEGAGAGSGPPTSPFSVPSTWSTGHRRMLYIRCAFPNTRVDPQSEAECHEALRQMSEYVARTSYGRCYFTFAVAPLVVLPYTEEWYLQASGGDGLLVSHARTLARSMGYDTSQYEYDVVRWNNGPGSYNGLAFVGSKGIRLRTSSVGTLCHELGHNLGVRHSNFWQTWPPSVTGPGMNWEYGNPFDVMGTSSGLGQYISFFKNLMSWLPQENFWNITSSGTYRIHQFDTPSANQDQRYAFRVRQDAERYYWGEFRQLNTNNPALMSGLMINWSTWGGGAIDPSTTGTRGADLLDMTPGSFGNGISDTRLDSALYVGRTFSDPEAAVHITPIAKNLGTTPPSMDVVVNVGAFPGNQVPTLSVGASATSVSVGAPVILTATASDPNSDPLSYAWTFDDGAYSTDNGSVQVKVWPIAGHYRVLCTVSDMKGGRVTRGVTIAVGSPTTFTVSGRVTGVGGAPLEGVYVANYPPYDNFPSSSFVHPNAAAFRGTWTDSDGNYTLTRMPTGIRTISPNLYPQVFTPSGFTNPLSVTGNVTGINFTSAPLPSLTVTATDNQAAEGASPNTGTVRIQRTGSNTSALAVQIYNGTSGTAVKNVDYTLNPTPSVKSDGSGSYELFIPAGQSFLDVTVTPTNDGTQEGVEYAVLDFPNTTAGYTLSGPTSATVSITDDDSSQPVVRLTAVDASAGETGADGAILRLERNGSTGANLAVTITYTGSATLNSDYTASTTVTIPSGSASITFAISPVDDPDQEGTETIIATLASNATYLRDAVSSSQTVVLMDDDLPIVTIAAGPDVPETSLEPTGFTVTRAGGDLTQPLTVDYSVAGRAIHGSDYLRLDGRAVIPVGATSTTISIQPIDDDVSEGMQDVICKLRSSTAYHIGVAAEDTLLLLDNEGAQVFLKMATSAVVTEPSSGSATVIRFEITRPAAGTAITVNYAVGGTATPGVDYATLPGSVSFASFETTKSISVNALSDAALEDAETVTLTLLPGTGYTFVPDQDLSATGFIVDQDQPTVDVSVADSGSTLTVTGTESSGSLRFIVSRRVATATDLTVNYSMSGTAVQGLDYDNTAGFVTIPANATSASVFIFPIDDSVAEGTETITLNVTAAPGTYGRRIGAATMLLGDNDAYGSGVVRFAASTSSTNESAGVWNIPVTLTGTSGGASVRYRVSGGTATGNGKDFTLTEGTLSFSPGQGSRNITMAVVQDSVPEPPETVTIELFNAIGANLSVSSHTLTLLNLSLPETWTDPASFVLLTSATLNGRVIPNGLATTAWFEYGPSLAYGSTTVPQSVGNGSTSVNVSASVSGLTELGYHFRCVSQNGAGTTYGADQLFGVDSSPAVVTNAASVNGVTATLNGTVNANGLPTTVSFEYGTTPAYGSTVAATPSPVNGTTDTAVSANLTGLTPGTQYHYRVRGENSAGAKLGANVTFTMPNNGPVASFVAAPVSPSARVPVTYSATGSDADGDPLTFSWDFRLAPAGPSLPLQTGASIKQTFMFGGTYNLTLTVSDGHGGTAVLTRTITVSDPATTWTPLTSGTTEDINAIATNGSRLAAVGDFGTALMSNDGVIWSESTSLSGSNPYLYEIIWDGIVFLTVGEEWDSSLQDWVGVIYSSPDGNAWSPLYASSVADSALFSIASSGLTRVAVGRNGTVARSTDNGASWNSVTIPGLAPDEMLMRVAFAGGNFVLTAFWSPGTVKVMTSPNGLTWTDRTGGSGAAGGSQDLHNLKTLNGRLIASGYNSSIRTSTNGGLSFTANQSTGWVTPALAFSDGLYLASGETFPGAQSLNVLSLDAQTWQAFPAHTTELRNAATAFQNRFYTVGDNGTIWRSGVLSAPPTIWTQPQGVIALKGDTVQFSIHATGSGPLAFSWRKSGVAIPGATGANYTILSALGSHSGTYDCRVTNSLGTATSVAVQLVVNSPAEIVTHPVSADVRVGDTRVFSVVASGDEPIAYQWRKDGVGIDGENTPTLTLSDIQVANRGNYDCVVTNAFGIDTSNPAVLNVLDKFLALEQPSFTVDESVASGKIDVPILRTGNLTGDIIFTFTVTKGTALTPSDYSPPVSTQITMPDGADRLEVPITIHNPANTPEANELFTVSLSNPPLGTGLITPSSAPVVIVDTSAYSNTLDKAVPGAPAISYPASGALVGVNTLGSLEVTGTVTDNKGVKEVQVNANGTGAANAVLVAGGAPTTKFKFSFVPKTGLNTITVKSFDYAGRSSSTVSRSFTVTRPLVVDVDTTLASVTTGFSPQSYREVGKSYTVIATPKPPTASPKFEGGAFVNWTIGGADLASGNGAFTLPRLGMSNSSLDKQSITFVFREGLALNANFITNPFNSSVAGTYNGLIKASEDLPDRGAAGTSPEDGSQPGLGTEGFFTASVMNTGAFSGRLTIDGMVLNVAGSFDAQGRARFGTARALTQTVARPNKPSLIVKFDIGGPVGSAAPPGTILGEVTAKDFQKSALPVAVSQVRAERAHFTGLTAPLTVPDQYLTVTGTSPAPAGRTDGVYTVVLPSVPVASQPPRIADLFDAQDYPPGDGVGTLKVTKSGGVSLVATLADGTAVTATGTLTQDLRTAFFAQLYTLKGFLSVPIKLDITQLDSDLKTEAGGKVLWSRPYNSLSHFYPYGWAETLEVDLLGARYAATAGQCVMRAPNGAYLQAADADGNVTLALSGGNLTGDLVKSANLSTTDVVTKVPDNDPTFTILVNRLTGAVTGTFAHTDDTLPSFNMIIIQKGPNAGARGYFLTKQPTLIDYTGRGGAASLIGQP